MFFPANLRSVLLFRIIPSNALFGEKTHHKEHKENLCALCASAVKKVSI